MGARMTKTLAQKLFLTAKDIGAISTALIDKGMHTEASNLRLIEDSFTELEEKYQEIKDELNGAQHTIDAVYDERNRIVALLARIYPSGIKKTAIEGWDPEWHNCVYIDSPLGQLSWHYHNREAYLFNHLPEYKGEWDGHDTEDKYARIYQLIMSADPRPRVLSVGDAEALQIMSGGRK